MNMFAFKKAVFRRIKYALGCACALFFAASFAEDLTVAKGDVHRLEAKVTYDTVNVSGTLIIPAGTSLTAATLNIGPNAGDEALIEITGSDEHHSRCDGAFACR